MTNSNFAQRLLHRSLLSLGLASLAASSLLTACEGDSATVIGGEPIAGTGGTSSDGNGGTGGGDVEAECVEDPTTNAEFLTQCTESACAAFDNAGRLGLFEAGQPLPEVP